MINKKGLWFLTLFSLILVLSVYYVTLPEELVLTNATNETEKESTINIEEKSALESLRIESDADLEVTMKELQEILTSADSSMEEKNSAYEQMKELNTNRSLEQELEKKLKDAYALEAFVKINGSDIQVIVSTNEHDKTLANNIMRTIQESFDTKKYISVKFQA